MHVVWLDKLYVPQNQHGNHYLDQSQIAVIFYF